MKRILILLLFWSAASCYAQDSLYVRKTIQILSSKAYWGRGYTKNGMTKAADFIVQAYKNFGLSPLAEKYRQVFSYSVNTFPGKMEVRINGEKLVPGKDFIVNNESSGIKLQSDLERVDSLHFKSSGNLQVVLKDKLTWSVASDTTLETILEINRKNFTAIPTQVTATIEHQFLPAFSASNVCGLVKGTRNPDSLLVITAHYDHLGGMGADTFFPGANDNAAGVANLLSLAKYYAAHPQPYSMVFICFAGEEAGLLGSRYFVEHPLVPLDKIKFLINLDLVGTGEAGMTVVNATVYPKAFALLNQINDKYQYISKINPRGKAANSDHYFFTETGVPAFFIYTQGGPKAYHDVDDKSESLPLTKYPALFKLLVDFNTKMMN